MVKELEFPKKKRVKGGRMQREREERTAILSSWLAKVRACVRVRSASQPMHRVHPSLKAAPIHACIHSFVHSFIYRGNEWMLG